MTSGGFSCSLEDIPAVDNEEIDMIVKIVGLNDSSKSYLATAIVCLNSNHDKRPTHGVIKANFIQMGSSEFSQYYTINNLLHEFIHLLGFSASQIPNFRNDDRSGPRPSSETIGSKYKPVTGSKL